MMSAERCPSGVSLLSRLKDDKLEEKLKTLAEKKIPILATSNLKNNLPEDLQASLNEALVLEVPADKWDLMNLREGQLHAIQEAMLQPFQITFKAPSRIALYLYEDDLTVIENFNDGVTVHIRTMPWNSGTVTSQEWHARWIVGSYHDITPKLWS